MMQAGMTVPERVCFEGVEALVREATTKASDLYLILMLFEFIDF